METKAVCADSAKSEVEVKSPKRNSLEPNRRLESDAEWSRNLLKVIGLFMEEK